jgi:hypothetical protein
MLSGNQFIMKPSVKRIAIFVLTPAVLLIASQLLLAKPMLSSSTKSFTAILQGSDLEARIAAVEKRIAALKQAVANPQNKQHRASVASLENRKNTIKFNLKSTDAKVKAQLEQQIKELEDKVAALESSVK